MGKGLRWYALKVFYGKAPELRAEFTRAGIESYYPVQDNGKPFVQSLLFVHCRESELIKLHSDPVAGSKFSIYSHKEKRRRLFSEDTSERIVPAPIDEQEMAVFMLVTSASPDSYDVLGPDDPKYHSGQLVRVLAGPFEGLVGRVRRIKKDRRLVIAITGVIAVATVHIDPRLLEAVEDKGQEEEQYSARQISDGFVLHRNNNIHSLRTALG